MYAVGCVLPGRDPRNKHVLDGAVALRGELGVELAPPASTLLEGPHIYHEPAAATASDLASGTRCRLAPRDRRDKADELLDALTPPLLCRKMVNCGNAQRIVKRLRPKSAGQCICHGNLVEPPGAGSIALCFLD